MILLFPHVTIGVWEIFMRIVREVVNMMKSVTPDAHYVALGLSLKHLLSYLGLNLDLFIRCLSLIYKGCIEVWVDQFAQEFFWSFVSH